MNLIQEIKKSMWTKYKTDTLYTVDNISFYLDHVPASVSYPIIVCRHISSGNNMAMPDPANGNNYGCDYVDSRIQVSIFANDRQQVDMEDIADRLETLYHRKSLPTANGVTHIATFSINQRTSFFDENIKVWGLHLTFRILAGK